MTNQQTRLKICGITNLEDARFAAGAMADYLGFIFYPGSARHVSPRTAAEISGWIEGPGKVGVFVNQPIEEVNSVIDRVGIDMVQLHGDESVDYARKVKKPVIKVFRVKGSENAADLEKTLENWKGVAAYFLFDAFDKKEFGGTGKTWDWSLMKCITCDTPFFLAGGISSDNVKNAVALLRPYAVDLSSTLEDRPGVKDFEKMQDFFDQWNEIRDVQNES